MEKVTKILDLFFNSKGIKYLGVYSLICLVLYIFSDRVNNLISNYFTIKESLLYQTPNIIVYCLFFIGLVYVFYKMILKRYQLSLTVLNSFFIFLLFYLITRFTYYPHGWQYISFHNSVIKYIDFIGFLLLTIFGIFFIKASLKHFKNKKTNKHKNPFIADDPVLSEKDDRLNYHKRASAIIEYIERSKFENSFTIGIVGPWGNGKSSLISLIEEKLNKKPINETIHLKFLPYLNHSETDIISEFFKQLSIEISKYSGRLSNQFLNYSDKLLKLYKDKSIAEFLKPNSSLFSNSTSYDNYKKINETLSLLDKRYIVFIDDLDRLSNNEVLQVLKLVRNTANFKNFIFLIALDKDYVLESLLVKSDIADHTFVDKFFQLEVYLPEIEKNQLKADFISLLKQTDLSFETNFIREAETCVYRDDNLFDDYISNFRGVKRLINQLVFDFKSLPDELDTNDFLNFTYLKMTFPYAIKFLNNNWSTVIPFNPETNLCELKEVSDVGDNNDVLKAIQKAKLNLTNQKLKVDYSKYEISKDVNTDVVVSESNNLSKQQNQLLIKTLIVLFGKENIADSHMSIKFENNLRKLLQQKVHENDLNETKFRSIFNFENDFDNLKQLLSKDHCSDILNRLAYFNAENKEETLKAIMILIYIFNDAESFGSFPASVWNILSNLINRHLKQQKGNINVWSDNDKHQIWKYITKEFINCKLFKLESKIKFLALISEYRIKLDFSDWGTTENMLKKQSLSQYKKLLESKQDNLWDIHDYTFYHAYHDVRKFHTADTINPITIEFWSKNDITLFCAQMTQNDVWTTKMLETSGYASQLFGSKKGYKDFINSNLPNPITPEIKEYIEFLEIESYSDFSRHIRYEFSKFDFVVQKLNRVIEFNKLENDEYENVVEIVLQSDTEKLWEVTHTNMNNKVISGYIESRRYNVDNAYYTFVRLETGNYHKAIPELFQHYQDMLNSSNIKSSIAKDNKSIIIVNSKEEIKLISVQPSSYN